MTDGPLSLRLVEDAPKRKRSDLLPLLQCHVCRVDTGHAGTTFIQVKRMPLIDKSRRVVGGVKASICADCLARGKVTVVT